MGEGAGGRGCVEGTGAACGGGPGKDSGVGALGCMVVLLAVERIWSFIEK